MSIVNLVRKMEIKRKISLLRKESNDMAERNFGINFGRGQIEDGSTVLRSTYLLVEEQLLMSGMSTIDVQSDNTLIVMKILLDKFISAQQMLDDESRNLNIPFSESELNVCIDELIEAFLKMEKKRIKDGLSINEMLEENEIGVLSDLLDRLVGFKEACEPEY